MRKLILPLALLIGAISLRAPSLVDNPGGAAASGVELSVSAGYVILSPLSRTLDALTLLSTQQLIALIVSVVLIVAIIAIPNGVKRTLISIAVTIVVFGALEAAAAFLPRPMAALTVTDPDIVRIDFHSHTGTSHDVRKSFTAAKNREWHRAGGFDLAYITDHVKFAAADSAAARNPARAGGGVSLVTGMEGRYHKIISTIVLGMTSIDSPVLDKRGNILSANLRSPRPPVTIIAIPNRNLDSLTANIRDSTVALPNLSAIELVDAAPRGLVQLDREEGKIRRIAADLRLALVAASNNHGYGRTVAGWNLMRVPGWQNMPPDSVASAIESQLRTSRGPVRIVHRARPSAHGWAVAAILPQAAYQVIGGLSLPERISWVAWILGISGVTFAIRRRR